jgi:hypothetical protein
MRRIIGLAVVMVCLIAWPLSAVAQSAPKKYLSAATTNATLVKAGPSRVTTIVAVNTGAAVYFLKLYNKATAPVCGTDVPVMTIPVPFVSGNAAAVSIANANGIMFPLGVGFCLTGGIADNDNTAAATGVAVNLGVTGQ